MCMPCVRALIVQDACSACIEVVGKHAIVDPCTNAILACRMNGKSREVSALRSGLKWGEEFPDIYQIKLMPLSPCTVITVNGVAYSGTIVIYDVEGCISVVNEVDIEDYVASILTSNIAEPVAKEALAALAIAQRTEAYYYSSFPRNNYWDFDATEIGYKGSQPTSVAVAEAVQATAFMVMNLPCAKKKACTDVGEEVGLFAAHWALAPSPDEGKPGQFRTAKLYVNEADAAARQGQNAVQILNKTFPGTFIQRMVFVN